MAATTTDSDPFSWDIDRVVKELCSAARTWEPTPNMKFPDPTALEARLREQEYDGELLLSSLDQYQGCDLWNDLGITQTKFKHTIRTAIRTFQNRSPAYRKFQKSLAYTSDDDQPFKRESHFLSPGMTEAPTPNSAPSYKPSPKEGPEEASKATVEPPAPPTEIHIAIRSSQNVDMESIEAPPEAPPKKKRRLGTSDLVALDIPAKGAYTGAFSVQTEADMFAARMPGDLRARLTSRPEAYWGQGSISVEEVIGLNETVDSDVEMNYMGPSHIGPGRANWVNGKLKQYLREPPGSRQTDDVHPLLGESGDEDDAEWDAIADEIEDEQEEIRLEKLNEQSSRLQSEAVDTCIQIMQEKLIARWQDKKLPGLQLRAYKLWTKAGLQRSRHRQVVQLNQQLMALTARLDSQVKELKGNTYANEKELEVMADILEPTVFEIETLKWTGNVLKSPHPPEKVSTHPATQPKKKSRVAADGGIDIWSEDEYDDLDDFIVDDDPPSHAVEHQSLNHNLDDDDHLPPIIRQVDDAMDLDTAPTPPPCSSFSHTNDSDVEMYDLTNIDDDDDDPIDLRTPLKPTSKPKEESTALTRTRVGEDLFPLFKAEELKIIYKKGSEYWLKKKDAFRLVITFLLQSPQPRRQKILEAAVYADSVEEFWSDQVSVAVVYNSERNNGIAEKASDKTRNAVAVAIAKLFVAYLMSPDINSWKKLPEILPPWMVSPPSSPFDVFWKFLCHLGNLSETKPEAGLLGGVGLQPKTAFQLAEKSKALEAARIQNDEKHSSQANEMRRREFRQTGEGVAQGYVINESKKEMHGLVYVHPHISQKIRNHQIEGVRFMWDEITKETQKGCLLAHSMGLGKTMQVITLLAALAETADSEDESMVSQLPQHLRSMKVLILCPPGLLNNWVEELNNWMPPSLLQDVHTIMSDIKPPGRLDAVRRWAYHAGPSILLIGYYLFQKLDTPAFNLVKDTCSIVIADEAHKFKNVQGNLRAAVHQLNTPSRIALTGSPLSNNILEYYSMIDWVSPGYLGELKHFKAKWATPIEDGLSFSASRAENRKSKILLTGLKKLVETKIHRRSTQILKGDLPEKQEFMIYVSLTPIQLEAYKAYLRGDMRDRRHTGQDEVTLTNVWALQAHMTLLVAHPTIYYERLKEEQLKEGFDEPDQNSKKSSPSYEDEVIDDADIGPSNEVLSEALKVFDKPSEYQAMEASHKMTVLETILDNSLKQKDNVLIFSQRLHVLNFIEEHLLRAKGRAYFRIDGTNATAYRQKTVNTFNKGHSQVFLISTTAGGVGLNLQGANRVVFMDFKYNPQHEQQAIGRAYRIGQTKKVSVYWLISDSTFEIQLQDSQVFKMQMSSRVVDSKAPIAKSDRSLNRWFHVPQEVERTDLTPFQGRDTILDAVIKLPGVTSLNTAESYEEEEVEDLLQPEELEQANQMALGNIHSVSVSMPKEEVNEPPFEPPAPLPVQPAFQPTPAFFAPPSVQAPYLPLPHAAPLFTESPSAPPLVQVPILNPHPYAWVPPQTFPALPQVQSRAHLLPKSSSAYCFATYHPANRPPQPLSASPHVQGRAHSPLLEAYRNATGPHHPYIPLCQLTPSLQGHAHLPFPQASGRATATHHPYIPLRQSPPSLQGRAHLPFSQASGHFTATQPFIPLRQSPPSLVTAGDREADHQPQMDRANEIQQMSVGGGRAMHHRTNDFDTGRTLSATLQSPPEPFGMSGPIGFDRRRTTPVAMHSPPRPFGVLGPEQVLKRTPSPGPPPAHTSEPNARVEVLRATLSETVRAGRDQKNFELVLREALGPLRIVECEQLVDVIAQQMDLARLQGLPRRAAWNNLTNALHSCRGSAKALARSTSQFLGKLVRMDEAMMLTAMEELRAAQDPDHARQFSQRSSKRENGSNSVSEDLAAMQAILNKREKKEKPVKGEERQSKKPRVSDGPGTRSDPLVID